MADPLAETDDLEQQYAFSQISQVTNADQTEQLSTTRIFGRGIAWQAAWAL